jgi:RHH-type proline utilization regulon transcriptional repressor/proline dehydrogenase/delta 1-pyrroline-5-carboxylate dehydrogenase
VTLRNLSKDAQALADQTTSLVHEWLTTADTIKASTAATLLSGVLSEEGGLDFTVGFVDGVIRPEDPHIAAENFRKLAANTPQFLPWYLRSAVTLGATVSHLAPQVVVPAAQRVLRQLVSHLIVDATDAKLGRSIAALKQTGRKLNVNLLGEAVLGPREAAKRLDGTKRLLERDDVDYVSIKVSSTVAPHSPWAFEQAADSVIEQLSPLYQSAAAHPSQ